MHKHHHAPRHKNKRFIDKAILVVAAVQPLGTIPQVVTIFKAHDASTISITSWAIYLLFDVAWLWYGFAEKQRAVIVSAVMFTIFEGAVTVGALMYGGTL